MSKKARNDDVFQKKNGEKEEKKSAPSGSIFKCPEGSSRVLMSCNPPLLLSCPGRAPPQHAFNIFFLYMYVCFVVVAMMAFCGSGKRKESHQERRRRKLKKSNAKFFFILAADLLISLLI